MTTGNEKLDPMLEKAIQDGFLDMEKHKNLIKRAHYYCEIANIPLQFLCGSAYNHCTKEEADTFNQQRKLISDGAHGMVLTGDVSSSLRRCQALAGLGLRGHRDCRVMSMQDITAKIKDNTMDNPTVLLIPNFFIEGANLPLWKVTEVLNILYSRTTNGRFTVLYIHDNPALKVLEKDYGRGIKEYLEGNYKILG